MKFNRSLVAVLALWLLSFAPTFAAAAPLTLGQKAALQAAMQQHIESRLVNGVYLRLDETSGKVRELRPTNAHPIILRMGAHFVLCSDFRDAAGNEVNIDFYITAKGRGYLVFDELVESREIVERLMKAGKIRRAG